MQKSLDFGTESKYTILFINQKMIVVLNLQYQES